MTSTDADVQPSSCLAAKLHGVKNSVKPEQNNMIPIPFKASHTISTEIKGGKFAKAYRQYE